MRNIREIALPKRISYWSAGRRLASEATVQEIEPGVYKIAILDHGVSFYWAGRVDNNLHYQIDQEFNSDSAHCYTTEPIRLSPESIILDIGACEGLFALRVLKTRNAARVIAFEPAEKIAHLLQRAAKENGVADQMSVEPIAVGRISGQVTFVEGNSPLGNRVVFGQTESDMARPAIPCVSLDDYCATHSLNLTKKDLIKIDAEGFDFDVLLGAENVIRSGNPQIAVTTYHEDQHVFEIVDWIRKVQPAYRMRLKGFSSWTIKPRPVLLQASLC